MGLPIAYYSDNNVLLTFVTWDSFDVTVRVLNVSNIHEYLDDDNCEFRISELELELDNSDNWLSYYNNWIMLGHPENDTVKLVISAGADNKDIWVGNADSQVFNSDNNTLKFLFKHEFEMFQNNDFGPTSDPYEDITLSGSPGCFIEGIFHEMNLNTNPEPNYDINMAGFYIWNVAETEYIFSDFQLWSTYGENGELTGLNVVGDYLRSFGCVLLNGLDREYWIKDRATLLAQTPVDVTDDLLGSITEDRWSKQRKSLRMRSVAYEGTGNPGDGQIYTDGYQGESAISIMDIETNMLCNLHVRTHLPSPDDIWADPSVPIREWILENIYQPWFNPGAAQTQMSFTLAGLSWFPGDAVQWDANFWVVIEETEKDLGNRKTRCTGLRVIVV